MDGTDLEVVVAVDKIAATVDELVDVVVFSRAMPMTCGLVSVLEVTGAEPIKESSVRFIVYYMFVR